MGKFSSVISTESVLAALLPGSLKHDTWIDRAYCNWSCSQLPFRQRTSPLWGFSRRVEVFLAFPVLMTSLKASSCLLVVSPHLAFSLLLLLLQQEWYSQDTLRPPSVEVLNETGVKPHAFVSQAVKSPSWSNARLHLCLEHPQRYI